MIYYAVLNDGNVCVELRGLHEETSRVNYLHLESEDFSVLGKKYNNGVWEEEEQPGSILDPPLTEAEQAVLQTAINTEYLLYLMESTI